MTDKELHKLSRRELLEMLLEQSKETDRLRARVQELEKALENKYMALENAGSIAEASLMLNGVFEAAQAAADQYLANIQRKNAEAEARCRQMVEQAKKKGEQDLPRTEELAQPSGGQV